MRTKQPTKSFELLQTLRARSMPFNMFKYPVIYYGPFQGDNSPDVSTDYFQFGLGCGHLLRKNCSLG